MNNEEQQNDERFTLVELSNGGFAVYDEDAAGHPETCIFWPDDHPYAKKAAEAERDRLNAWHSGSGQIAPPITVERPPVGIVKGKFFKPSPEFLTVAEKRCFLANVFRSPDFTDADKFQALQEDNKMLAMFSLGNGKEQSHD